MMVIIDNNPSINKMTYNSIYAADVIICPTNISEDIEGSWTHVHMYAGFRALPVSHKLQDRSYDDDTGNSNCKEGAKQLRAAFGKDVFDTQIQFNRN